MGLSSWITRSSWGKNLTGSKIIGKFVDAKGTFARSMKMGSSAVYLHAQTQDFQQGEREGLKIFNTLGRKKEPFLVREDGVVSWYTCGPTVYDKSHLGHARTYITFDYLRRIMKYYFGYDVLYIMNITDIDDKIIKGARYEEHFKRFVEKAGNLKQGDLEGEIEEAIDFYRQNVYKQLIEVNDKNEEVLGEDGCVKLKADVDPAIAELKINAMTNAIELFKEFKDSGFQSSLLEGFRSVLCPWLDFKDGNTINENEVFANFARKWEVEFLKDMKSLNVLPSDVLTRVSEYVPEIVKYIEKIIETGFAYVLNGSVYFDVEKFNSSPGHKYAKLEPGAFNDAKLVSDGEGEFQNKQDSKKSPADFALWKKSKLGEPSWESPWGSGRPGWHIECSVMASDVSGKILDIHAGGIDLTFPHHDNELAQSEAYHESENWVRYFLHTGHLNIKGLKMSKSLKNFITIQEILKTASPKQLRIMFLLSHWSQTFDYNSKRLDEARHYESLINNFLAKADAISVLVKNNAPMLSVAKFKSTELDLLNGFTVFKKKIHTAFCDSFNTPYAMSVIKDLIDTCNSYISAYDAKSIIPNPNVLNILAAYVRDILNLLGVSTVDTTDTPYNDQSLKSDFLFSVNEFSNFRSRIRNLIKEGAAPYKLLEECDKVRDDVLPSLGVQIDDIDEGLALVKFIGKEAALEAKKAKLKNDTNDNVAKKSSNNKKKDPDIESIYAIESCNLFKTGVYAGNFSEFDENGIPTKDINNVEISKSLKKKLQKKYLLHDEQRKQYLKSLNNADK